VLVEGFAHIQLRRPQRESYRTDIMRPRNHAPADEERASATEELRANRHALRATKGSTPYPVDDGELPF
jgi:hypothetical protein